MASLTSIPNPEDQQDIEAKKRERATLISTKQAEKLRICGGQGDDGSYVKGELAEVISLLQNTCVITGRPCEMEQTGKGQNWRREHESYYKCKNCGKQTTRGGGRKKKTRRKKRRKKRRKTRRKKRTRKRLRKKRTKRRK